MKLTCSLLRNKGFLAFLVLMVAFLSETYGANRFWVSSIAGNWNNAANWSTTSGGAGGASVPGASDIAIFDGNGLGNCSITTNLSVQGITISAGYTGIIDQQTGVTISIGTGGYNQASGTFTGGNSTIDLNSGTFTLSGGTFNSTTGTLFIGSNFALDVTLLTISAGTFNANSGTVRLDPDFTACAQRIATVNLTPTITFVNLILDISNLSCTEDIVVFTGTIPNVTGTLTHFDGFFNTGTINLQGNLTIEASADGGSGIIQVNGAATQDYTHIGTGRTSVIQVNKSAGNFSPALGTTTLRCQRFIQTAGTFTAPTGEFRVGGSHTGNPALYTYTAGTFAPNGGTLYLDPIFGECAQRSAIVSVASSFTINNLILEADDQSCTEDIISITGTGNIIVGGELTHSDGFINNGTIELTGNLILGLNADGGSTVILMNGSGAQTYSNSSTARLAHLQVNKTSGSVAAAVGTTSLRVQRFTLTSGTFVAPTGEFRIGGNWIGNPTILTYTGGTFNANNGTTYLDPVMTECSQRTVTISATSAFSFYNLFVQVDDTSCSEDILSLGGTSNFVVANDFTHIDGFINSGTLQVSGNINLQTGADGGSGTILLNGTGNQTYNNSSTARFAHLRINKSTGDVSPGVGTTTFLVQQFTLDAGTFNAPSGEFSIGGSWSGVNPTLFTLTGGTFNAGTGTVKFDPVFTDCSQRTATLSSPSPVTFFNLTIQVDDASCTEDIFLVSGASTVIVSNDFTHVDGFINTGTIEVRGNVYLQTGADGGTATILMNGTTDQTYNNTSTARFAHLRINKTSGVVNPGVGTTTFLVQQFTQDAGTFNAPTGQFSIGGNWSGINPTLFTFTSGTFNAGTGTVKFDPSFTDCSQRTATLSSPSPINFYDLIIQVDDLSCTEDIFLVNGTSTVIVTNDFTHTDGFINTGTIEVRGDVFLQSGADGGNATITMNGTTDQTYNNSSSARFAHLKIDKTSGIVTPGVGTTSFLVQQFTLAAGTFFAPTGQFSIGGNWSGVNPTIFTYTSGTFDANTGTVSLDPTFTDCSQRTATMTSSIPVNFYNLIVQVDDVSCTEDILSVTGTSTIIVLNDFTQTDGFINTGTIEVRGDVYLGSGADGGNATILLNGTTDQEYFNSSTARFAHVRVNKTSGSVIPGSGTTTLLVQKFTLDAGTFVAPSGEFKVGGSWVGNQTIFQVNGGTFTDNSGTVRLDPSFTECAQRSATINTNSAITFYNLIAQIDNASCVEDILLITGASTIIVRNDYTHTNGFINTGTIEVRGNIYLESGADGGNATILMNGTIDQTYNNSSTARFSHLQINKSSGVVNPGPTTTTLNLQQFTLTAGIFNAPTGDLRIGGTWTGNPTIFAATGGTFNAGTGTLRLDATFTECTQRTATINTTVPLTFNNVNVEVDDVSCTEDILTVVGSTTILITGNLNLTDGFFNSGTFNVQGNVTVSSSFDGGSGALQFSGSSDQNFTLTGATGNFNGDIILNKTSGQVILQSTLQIDAAAQDITFTNGLLTTSATNLLIIGDNVLSAGGSATSYINGPVRKIGNDGFTFPTGKSGIFSPIRISAPAVVTDAFDAEYFVADPATAGYPSTTRETSLKDVSTCDYWILNRTTGTSNVQVGLTWNRATGCYGFTNTFFLAVARWDGTQWTNAGMTFTTDNGATGTVNSPTVSSFSPFAIGSQAFPLPVKLLSFKADWVSSNVHLNWVSSSEVNNDHFTLERSGNGIDFKNLTQVPSKWQGMKTSYSYVDELPLPGISYYRLKQTDLDGTTVTLETIAVVNPYLESSFTVYPNPASGRIIQFSEPTYGTIKTQYNEKVIELSGQTSIEINSLSPGVYIVTNSKGEKVRLIIL